MNIISAVLLNMQKRKEILLSWLSKRVILKRERKCAHFAHQNQITVRSLVKENQRALTVKGMLHGLAGTVSRTSILEAYLPRLRQRPDILLANLAIEIQCSRLSHQRFIERTQNYLNNSYQVWWILGNSFLDNRNSH